MKSQKQLILASIFLAILVLPIAAICILQIGQAYIKTSREERLQTEKLEKVVILLKDLVWEEDGEEIWIGDRMFDVASMEVENGLCILSGVFDDDETEIAGTLLHTIFSKGHSQLLQLLILLQCFAGSLLLIDFGLRQWTKQKRHSTFLINFPSPCFVVLGPPPRQ